MDESKIPPVPNKLRSFANPPSSLRIKGIDGLLRTVNVRLPTGVEESQILKSFRFVDERLTVAGYRAEIRTAMHAGGFLITRNWDIGAGYTSRSANIIILNANMFDHTRSRDVFEEFCVTVLHELLHFFQKGADETYTSGSEEEARHDLATYGLLGIGIPVHHWAFKVYPHLLTELQQPGVGK